MEDATNIKTGTRDCSGPLVLRTVSWFSGEYGYWVARCLETGSVATADDEATALSMLDEVLGRELADARETGNWPNLFSTPAPKEVWRLLDRASSIAHMAGAGAVET